MSVRVRTAAIASVLAAAAAGAPGVSGATAQAAACDRFASPSGSDTAPGTLAAPYATVTKLAGALQSGQTGCLRGGDYGWSGNLSLRTPGIELTSYPGEHAALHGRLRIEASADDAVLAGLTLDGRNPNGYVSPLIYADRVVLRDNDISNHHAGESCVHIATYSGSGPPQGVVIEGNRIHDCGRLPATNKDHGIYNATGQGTVIRDNWIHGNADRGVQLYPNADDTLVTGNVIDGNGQGVLFASGSDDNLVEHNLITNSVLRYNVESSGLSGTGNVARENCVWTTRGSHRGSPDGSGIQSTSSFAATANVVVDPLYENRAAGDYDLRSGSACASVLGTGSPPPQDDPIPPAEEPPPNADTTPPETAVTSHEIVAPAVTFTFESSEPGSSFECRVDGWAGWTECESPITFPGLNPGDRVFFVRATDAAENTDQTPAEQAFTLEPEDPPAEDPPAEDPPTEDPPAEEPPPASPPAPAAPAGFTPTEIATPDQTSKPPGTGSRRVRLRSRFDAVGAGERFKLTGRVKSSHGRDRYRVVLQVWRGGRWERFTTKRVSGRRFTARPRVAVPGELHFRAKVRRVGRSRPISVTVLG